MQLPLDVLILIFHQLNGAKAAGGGGGGGGGAVIRAACRGLRDAFDSCNTRLVLGGIQPPEDALGEGYSFRGPHGPKLGEDDSAPQHIWAANRRARIALFRGLITRTPCLDSLRIREWLYGQDIGRIGLPWAQLRQLDIRDCSNLPLKHLPLSECSALERLDAEHSRWFGGLPRISCVSTLRYLRTSSRGDSDAAHVANVATCTQLERLSIECSGHAPLSACSRLTHLHLTCNVLASLPMSLCHLDLTCNSADLTPLCSLTALQRLQIIVHPDDALLDIAPLASCCEMQHLDLSACCVDDVSPLSGMLGLRSLLLSQWHVQEVPPLDLAPLASCAELEHLQLHCFYGLTDLSPLTVLVLLRSLSLRSCSSVRDVTPLSGLTALQHLDLGVHLHDFENALPQQQGGGPPALEVQPAAEGLDLAPLAGLAAGLLQLGLSGRLTETADLSPLSDFTALQVLDLSSDAYVGQHRGTLDLTPLSTCISLGSLDLNRVNCNVRSTRIIIDAHRYHEFFTPYSIVEMEAWDLGPLEALSGSLQISVKQRWCQRERGNTWGPVPEVQGNGAAVAELKSWWKKVMQTGAPECFSPISEGI